MRKITRTRNCTVQPITITHVDCSDVALPGCECPMPTVSVVNTGDSVYVLCWCSFFNIQHRGGKQHLDFIRGRMSSGARHEAERSLNLVLGLRVRGAEAPFPLMPSSRAPVKLYRICVFLSDRRPQSLMRRILSYEIFKHE
jgi:hypothetical protein